MPHNIFEKISHNWWNKQGPCEPLHSLNATRFNYIKNTSIIKNKTILDIGCGGGILSEKLALHGAKVTGIDISNSLINIAKTHSKLKNLKIIYKNYDINTFCKENNKKFDIIICMEILEHINKKNSFFKNLKFLSTSNGLLFISSINKTIETYIYIILFGEYINQKIEKKTHLYENFISINEIKYNLNKINFTIQNIKNLKYNPLLKYSIISKNIPKNYIIKIRNEN